MKATSSIHRQTNADPLVMGSLRGYFMLVGLAALSFAGWGHHAVVPTHEHGAHSGFQAWVSAMDSGAYFLTIAVLLLPWWRLGDVFTALAYAIVLPSCVYVIFGFSIVDLIYVHRQTLLHFFLLSGILAQVVWLFLRLRVESRRATIAHLWKERLRQNHKQEIEYVEQFILEIEGEDKDPAQWSRFAETSNSADPMGMWKRLDAEWRRWLAERNALRI